MSIHCNFILGAVGFVACACVTDVEENMIVCRLHKQKRIQLSRVVGLLQKGIRDVSTRDAAAAYKAAQSQAFRAATHRQDGFTGIAAGTRDNGTVSH